MSDEPTFQDNLVVEFNAETIAKIDVLVEENLYPNRESFVEQAIRAQLNLHSSTFEGYEKKNNFVIGIVSYNAKELEKIAAQGKKLEIKVIGALRFAKDVTPELVERTVGDIYLSGILKAPNAVLPAINERRYTITGRSYHELLGLTKQKQLKEGEGDNHQK